MVDSIEGVPRSSFQLRFGAEAPEPGITKDETFIIVGPGFADQLIPNPTGKHYNLNRQTENLKYK